MTKADSKSMQKQNQRLDRAIRAPADLVCKVPCSRIASSCQYQGAKRIECQCMSVVLISKYHGIVLQKDVFAFGNVTQSSGMQDPCSIVSQTSCRFMERR